jgi:hypothetical protein
LNLHERRTVMKAFSHFLAVLFALALLAATGFGAYLGLEILTATFSSLSPWVQLAALCSAVLLLAASWVASALRQSGRDRLAVSLREEKAATYRLFADLWQRRLQPSGAPDQPWPAALAADLRSLDALLVLCGSAALIEAHARLHALDRQHGPAHAGLQPALVRALVQMRSELQAEPLSEAALHGLLWPATAQQPSRAEPDGALPAGLPVS